jgi:hypothetical protein
VVRLEAALVGLRKHLAEEVGDADAEVEQLIDRRRLRVGIGIVGEQGADRVGRFQLAGGDELPDRRLRECLADRRIVEPHAGRHRQALLPIGDAIRLLEDRAAVPRDEDDAGEAA